MCKSLQSILTWLILGVVTFSATVFSVLYKDRNEEEGVDYVVVLEESAQKELSFSLSEMFPGDESSYEVQVTARETAVPDLEIAFDGEGALAAFVEVELSCAGEVVDGGLLVSYLKGKKTTLPVGVEVGNSKTFTVTYRMDESVGNEALGATADFRMVMSLKK